MRFTEYKCTDKKGCVYEWKDTQEDEPCLYCGKTYEENVTIWFKLYCAIPHRVREFFKMSSWSRCWRFFWQRRNRGFDDSELWSLDYTCAKLMAPRLRAFIDYGICGVPSKLAEPSIEEGTDEWREILEKIQKAFQAIVDCDSAMYMLTDKEHKEIEEGLDLFREYFFHLWN
jgi:hypothetical protein